jgi:lipopolysaccharide transport system ATP-binding protein
MDDIIAFAELEDSIENPVRTYSSGMRLRLGFAVAVHAAPAVLLIDEVLSVGDLAFQQKCLARIRRFKEEGCAIVLITHDLEQVKTLCDKALWLRHGECVAFGDPDPLIGDYKAEMQLETKRRAPGNVETQFTANGVALRMHENRYGSLEAQIRDVRILGAGGERADQLKAGEALHLEIQVYAPSVIGKLHACVSLGRATQGDILDLNTDTDLVAIENVQGETQLELWLDRLDLAAGEYEVSVGLFDADWRYAYDYHSRAYRFEITDTVKASGTLAPPRRWIVR